MTAALSGCAKSTSPQVIQYYNKGVDLMNSGQYDSAVSEFSQAIAIDQNYANAWINRGYCYFMKKQYPSAITDYSRGIDLNPKDTHALNGRGASYLMLKQYENALADFNQAIKLDPNFTKAIENRDYAQKMLGTIGDLNTVDSGVGGDTNITKEWPTLSDENKIVIYEATITGNVDDNEGQLSYHINPTILRACGGKPNNGSDYPYKWSSPDKLEMLGIELREDGTVIEYGGGFPLHEGTRTFAVEVTDGKLIAKGMMTLEVKRYDSSSKSGIPGVPGSWASLQQWPQEVVDKYPLPSAKAGHYYGVTLPVLGGTLPYDFSLPEEFAVDESEGKSGSENPGLSMRADCGVICGIIPVSLAGETFRFSINVTDRDGETDPYCPEYTIKVVP